MSRRSMKKTSVDSFQLAMAATLLATAVLTAAALVSLVMSWPG